MEALSKLAGERRFLMVGDSKLVSYANLSAMVAAGVRFITPADHFRRSTAQWPCRTSYCAQMPQALPEDRPSDLRDAPLKRAPQDMRAVRHRATCRPHRGIINGHPGLLGTGFRRRSGDA
jgi:hypothetical protein